MVTHLSYWEKSIYFKDLDVAIIGAGIVGLCTGISLLERDPSLRVVILERHYLPLGASTKNAGFACFGSPSELLDDLIRHEASSVFDLFKKRYQGIQKLIRYTGSHALDLENDGGNELIHPEYSKTKIDETIIDELNTRIYDSIGIKQYFYFDSKKLKTYHLSGFEHLIANNHESSLHPVKMIEALSKLFTDKKGKIFFGAHINSWHEHEKNVTLALQDGSQIDVKKIVFCVNGFATQLLPQLDVQAARNMVLLVRPENELKLKGCFHIDRGYFYFRNVDGNLLIGGGRHLDPVSETTSEFGINEKIKKALLELIEANILKDIPFRLIDQWSGILGLGSEKKPIIQMTSRHVGAAVRMGGMGIAIGSLVGDEAAEMIYHNLHQTP